MEQRDVGTAVLAISEDLDEVMSISDRVLVMFEGRIIGSVDPRTSTREAIGLLMAGIDAEASATGNVAGKDPAASRRRLGTSA